MLLKENLDVFVALARRGDCGPGIWVTARVPMRTLVDTGALDAWPLRQDDREWLAQNTPVLLAAIDAVIAAQQAKMHSLASCLLTVYAVFEEQLIQ